MNVGTEARRTEGFVILFLSQTSGPSRPESPTQSHFPGTWGRYNPSLHPCAAIKIQQIDDTMKQGYSVSSTVTTAPRPTGWPGCRGGARSPSSSPCRCAPAEHRLSRRRHPPSSSPSVAAVRFPAVGRFDLNAGWLILGILNARRDHDARLTALARSR